MQTYSARNNRNALSKLEELRQELGDGFVTVHRELWGSLDRLAQEGYIEKSSQISGQYRITDLGITTVESWNR